jgi:hypothetical protein
LGLDRTYGFIKTRSDTEIAFPRADVFALERQLAVAKARQTELLMELHTSLQSIYQSPVRRGEEWDEENL